MCVLVGPTVDYHARWSVRDVGESYKDMLGPCALVLAPGQSRSRPRARLMRMLASGEPHVRRSIQLRIGPGRNCELRLVYRAPVAS